MCGLAGIVGEVDLMEQVLLHMSAAQNHRGKETPNSWVSSFIDARVGLMHNRMKTIDMAVAPKQPFEDNDTGLVVMLDGEIFNYEDVRRQLENYYSFTTRGMCEVITKAYDRWGDGCFDRFEGYFSIVIYNRWSEELLLCRDRFGINPCIMPPKGVTYFSHPKSKLCLPVEFVRCCRRNDGRVTWPILLMAVLMKLFGKVCISSLPDFCCIIMVIRWWRNVGMSLKKESHCGARSRPSDCRRLFWNRCTGVSDTA